MSTPDLSGDDAGQRGLAEPGGSGKQHMVERPALGPGGLDRDPQTLLDRDLANEIFQPPRTQSAGPPRH